MRAWQQAGTHGADAYSAPAVFSPDYFTARERFLTSAARAGAALSAIQIPATGPSGEPLFIDIATLDGDRADAVVAVSCGLHGVEGFVGSAVELAWLTRLATSGRRLAVRTVLMHALNPFGFAWLRRVNEHNVDLNRNFLAGDRIPTDEAYRHSLSIYDRMDAFLNPRSPPSRWEPYALKAVIHALAAGPRTVGGALPVGQYAHADGLFYGGHGPEVSTTAIRGAFRAIGTGAALILHVDIHSGLGRWGQRQLFIADAPGTDRARWIADGLGPDVRPSDDRIAYRAWGTMNADLRDRLAPTEYHGVTVEFGTHSGLRVLGALRAEHRAHVHASPSSRIHAWAKHAMLDAFVPSSAQWRTSVVESGVALVDRAEAAAAAW